MNIRESTRFCIIINNLNLLFFLRSYHKRENIIIILAQLYNLLTL